MNTIITIASFELKQRSRLISTYVYFLAFALLAGFWTAAAGGAIQGAHVSFGSEKIMINSPYAVSVATTLLGFMSVNIIAAIMGRAIYQDYEHSTYHFFFTAPIAKRDYWIGRYLGAFISLVLILCGIGLGLILGTLVPGVDTSHVGPMSWQIYFRPYLFGLLPNVFWMGAIFFVIGALTRQIAPVYVGGVIVLIGYLLASNLLFDMDKKELAALLDPVGVQAQSVLVRYWSVAEKNTQLLPFVGPLALNRLIWCTLGVIIFGIGYLRFKPQAPSVSVKKRKTNDAPTTHTQAANISPLQPARLDYGFRHWLSMLPSTVAVYLGEILRSPRFLVIAIGGAVYMCGSASTMGNIYGTNTWPVTWQVLEVTSNFFGVLILIISAIYAGELIWRERDVGVAEIVDATPQPTWLPFTSKFLALAALQALLISIVLLCSIGIQLWNHYYHFELGHALFELYAVQWPDYLILGSLAICIHTLVHNKYVGHFIVVGWYAIQMKLADFGFENKLYLFGSHPDLKYSDMNGYGHFLPAVRWFQLYWGSAAILLLVVTYLFWVRGKETTMVQRAKLARQRGLASALTHPSPFITPTLFFGITAAVAFLGTGSWIYYNTHILNHYQSTDAALKSKADYEINYKQFEWAARPDVIAIDLNIDLFPKQHRTQIRGQYQLVNNTQETIQDLYISLPSYAQIHTIKSASTMHAIESTPELSWYHYRFDAPLPPNAHSTLDFNISYAVHGFKNDGAAETVLDNGTFLNGAEGSEIATIPAIGYLRDHEIQSDRDRKRFGLAPRERAYDLDDPRVRMNGPHWLDHLTTTISTSADQLPIASGDKVKEWTEESPEGPRHFVRYEVNQPLLPLTPVLSGRYAIKRDQWQRAGKTVSIEIDYQPGHEFDLDRMIDGVKDSLDYFDAHFSAYQFNLLRIIEFPRYHRFAESFPNTVPFSESIGFIAKVDDHDPKDIDYPYFVTAHEVAHQWWGHQSAPANAQGAEFLNESLAEYSALMVLKHKYGDAKIHRFLRYELDKYLVGRSMEEKKEQPLMRADGPAYLHYRKGSLALYALQDAIGEDAVNQALSAYLQQWAFKGSPFPTARDLIAEFRKVTPSNQQSVISDLFESITFYDLRAEHASIRETSDHQFEITLNVSARKTQSDGLGADHEVNMNESVAIGALDEHQDPIWIEKRLIHSGSNQFQFVVKQKPAKVGIDPLNILIDRIPSDNVITPSTDSN